MSDSPGTARRVKLLAVERTDAGQDLERKTHHVVVQIRTPEPG